MDFRIGHGYDAHQLVEGRRLVLGGVKVPHTLGLLGHSDADVLLHAVMDAIIGALALVTSAVCFRTAIRPTRMPIPFGCLARCAW